MIPVNLEMQSEEGLTVNHVAYPRPFKRRFAFQTEPIPVHVADFAIEFQLKAAKDATPGAHTLRGKLTFQLIDETGVGAVQQLEVQFPITVVEAGTQVTHGQWPGYLSNPEDAKTYALLALFTPLLLPLMLVMWLVCGIEGRDCSS